MDNCESKSPTTLSPRGATIGGLLALRVTVSLHQQPTQRERLLVERADDVRDDLGGVAQVAQTDGLVVGVVSDEKKKIF